MITAFLFTSKLINSRDKTIDWIYLYASRIMRLTPLYLFAIFFVFLIVAYLSHFERHTSYLDLWSSISSWLLFSIFGTVNINALPDTRLIVAGVPWSLVYEWIFYLLLPVLSLAFKVRPSIKAILCATTLAVLFFKFGEVTLTYFRPFFAGVLAAILVRNTTFRTFAQSPIASIIILGVLAIDIYLYPDSYKHGAVACASIAFILIAGGNNLFGLLTNKYSVKLGDFSYSIYLLHGLIVFTTLNFIIGRDTIKTLSMPAYWLIISILAFFVVFISYLTFTYIEKPGIARTKALSYKLHQLLDKKTS